MNNIEEREYEELRRLGQKLHIPTPEHFIELEVRDKDGNLLCPSCSSPIVSGQEKCPNCGAEVRLKQRSHSWVRNAYNLLLAQMSCKNLDDPSPNYGPGFLNIKLTDGTIEDGAYGARINNETNHESSTWGYRGGAGDSFKGILVGNDATAESFEDFKLLGKIGEGMVAGQLNHVATAVPTKSYDAPTKTWTITWNRYFNNNSPGVVDVNEVALYTGGMAGGGTRTFAVTRDKLPATVTIPATGQLKVTYTIQLTYPA